MRLVGEATSGSLFDVLQKHTSNAWLLSLSNQIYQYPDKKALGYATTPEGRGINVHYELVYDAMSFFYFLVLSLRLI